MNHHIAKQHPLLKSTTDWVTALCLTFGDFFFFLTLEPHGGKGGVKFRKRETVVIRSDEGLTLETSALKLLTVANSRYQLS